MYQIIWSSAGLQVINLVQLVDSWFNKPTTIDILKIWVTMKTALASTVGSRDSSLTIRLIRSSILFHNWASFQYRMSCCRDACLAFLVVNFWGSLHYSSFIHVFTFHMRWYYQVLVAQASSLISRRQYSCYHL